MNNKLKFYLGIVLIHVGMLVMTSVADNVLADLAGQFLAFGVNIGTGGYRFKEKTQKQPNKSEGKK